MKLFNKIRNKAKKKVFPTTTLTKYKLVFQTVDGVTHELNRLKYIDEQSITCSALDFYLIGKKFLQDDDDVQYPIQNIVSIKFEKMDKKEDVIKMYDKDCDYFHLIWYGTDEIEILKKAIDN